MSYLYVCEQGARISFEENRFDVRYKGAVLQSIPAEMLEIIEVFGKVQITGYTSTSVSLEYLLKITI